MYKGKEYFLIFQSADGGVITIRGHHGMKGKWPLEAARSDRQHPNVHFRLDLTWETTGIVPEAFLYFQNERFGQFEILVGAGALERSLDSLAPAFLGPFQITLEDWRSRWSKLRGTTYLRKVLMDQTTLCSGIGLYLLVEILWEARLHPDVIITQIHPQEIETLFTICQRVIRGHYVNTREKVIYKKKATPTGYPIAFLDRNNRKIWFSPQEQLPR